VIWDLIVIGAGAVLALIALAYVIGLVCFLCSLGLERFGWISPAEVKRAAREGRPPRSSPR
jgi:hypothetical protein